MNTEELTLNGYQKMALETAAYPKEFKVIYPSLGLNGESGEVADKVKKIIRDGDVVKDGDGAIVIPQEKRHELAKELGDVLWYIATLSYDIGYSLGEIGEMNYKKLKSRKERGVLSGSGDNR